MSLVDNIFAQAAQQQVALYNRVAEYKEQEAAYDLLRAKEMAGNATLMKKQLELQLRPSIVLKPALSREGTDWVAIYGDCEGRGPTPELAFQSFDAMWLKGNPDAGIDLG
jgi:hypothetical protein